MNQSLRTAIALVPLIQSLTYGEASVAATDLTGYLLDVPGKQLHFNLKPGDSIREGSGSHDAIQTGKIVTREQPASVFGFPYLVNAAPIWDESGAVAGSMVVRLPLQLEADLARIAGELATAMTQFSATFQDVAAIAENTTQTAAALKEAVTQMREAQQQTVAVTKGIARVTDQTRLLGLNALIEAAHAGPAGAGFRVVAGEIQALSMQSLKATRAITDSLKVVARENETVQSETQSLQTGSENLYARVEESQPIVRNLADMARNLQKLANRATSGQ